VGSLVETTGLTRGTPLSKELSGGEESVSLVWDALMLSPSYSLLNLLPLLLKMYLSIQVAMEGPSLNDT